MLKPRALNPGDRIALVAPASSFAREAVIDGAAELRRLGYVPVYEESVFAREDYVAGPAESRAAAFMRHWADPEVAALVAVRGGFGSVHVLPLLDRSLIVKQPKLFIAYSDNTSILSWLNCQCGITALHGPMLDGRLARGISAYDESSFLALLQGGRGLTLSPDGMTVLRPGEARGRLFGGTLTQLAASLGTPYNFDPPDNCVLFLEDVNERPYRVDRLLTQLRLSGVLGRARALVFGEMRGCDESQETVTARDVIRRMTADCPGPVICGFPSGHTTGPCWTLPLGVEVSVTTSPRPSVLVEEAPVE